MKRRDKRKRNKRNKSKANLNKRTGFSLERLDDRVMLDGAGLVNITSPLGADETQQQEDFNVASQPAGFETAGSSLSFTGTDVLFDGAGDGQRTYLRTVADDFYDQDFVAEVTYTSGGWIGFFGIGTGDNTGGSMEPAFPSVHVRLHPSSGAGGRVDATSSTGSAGFGFPGDGTHRLRMTWDATNKTALFEIDEDYTGGEFAADLTSPVVAASPGMDSTNSRLFFGGASGLRFDNLEITFPSSPAEVSVAENETEVTTVTTDASDGTISVGDPSFEGIPLSQGDWGPAVAPWISGWVTIEGAWGLNHAPVDGLQALAAGPSTHQLLADTYQEGVTYTLSAWVTSRGTSVGDMFLYRGDQTFDADNSATYLATTHIPANTQWVQSTVQYTATAADAGEQIGIGLHSGSFFDVIELTSDSPSVTPTFSISGGDDAGEFEITAGTGELSFVDAPDFESADDVGGNNVYEVEVEVAVTGNTRTAALALNPAGYYSFDTVTGTTVTNEGSTGSVNDGVLSNGAGLTVGDGGVLGAAMTIDSSAGDDMLILDADGIDIDASGWTASAWFKGIYTGGHRTMFRGSGNDHQALVDFGTNDLGVWDNAGGTTFHDSGYNVDSIAGDGNWHNLVARGNADGTTDLFVDGNLVGTSNYRSESEITWIGNIFNGTQGWGPLIDEVSIFTTPLDDGEIASIATGEVVSDTQLIAVSVTDVVENQPPVIDAPDSVDVPENQSAITVVSVADPDEGDAHAYSLTNSEDDSVFDIDSESGALTFDEAADFEGEGGTEFSVDVTVTDAGGLSDSQVIAISVTDENEAPVIGAPLSVDVPENQSAIVTVSVDDPDADDTHAYSLTDAPYELAFDIDSETGVLTFTSVPDFEGEGGTEFSVDVTVTDAGGLSDSQIIAVTLTNENEAPVIDVDSPIVTINEGDTAGNTGTFGDIDAEDSASLSASIGSVSEGETPGSWEWSYSADAGPEEAQDVTIWVTDGGGLSASTTFSLVVENVVPGIAVDNASVNTPEGMVAVNTGTFFDVGEVSLSASVGHVGEGEEAGTWIWTYGTVDGPEQTQLVAVTADDGYEQTSATFQLVVNNVSPVVTFDNATVTVSEGATATNSGTLVDPGDDTVMIAASRGEVVNNGNGTWNWTFDATDGPSETGFVTITVTDSDSGATATTFDLVVENVAPVIESDGPVTVNEGEIATTAGTYSDAGGDAIDLSASRGEVTDNEDGTWSWSLATADGPDESGIITITATDEDGLATPTTFDLTVNNVAPTISVDDESAVTVAEGDTATNSGTFGDIGADAVTLNASVGEVTDNEDGTWSWAFETTDGDDDSQTVTITAEDEDGLASMVTFELVVDNVAPVVSVDNVTAVVDESDIATNSGTVSDVGDDTVGLSASIGEVTAGQGDGTWEWSYQTTDGPHLETVTITATDSDGAESSTTFDLTVNNVAPSVEADVALVVVSEGATATNTGTFSDVGDDTVGLSASVGQVSPGEEDGTWSWSFDTTDGDDESQTVTVTATDSDGAETTTTFELQVDNVAPVVTVDNESVTVTEGNTVGNTGTFAEVGADAVELTASVGSVIDNGNGTWSWSYDATDGPDETQEVSIAATDSDGAETTVSFQLNVNNVAPTVSADNALVEVTEGETATNSGTMFDVGVDTVSLAASAGTVVDAGEGTWTWSLDTTDGTDDSQTITITATDSDGLASTTTFDLSVSNVAPVVTTDNDEVTINEGDTATNTGTVSDIGADTIDSLTASAGEVVLDAETGTWSWSFDSSDGPDGSGPVTITATDSDGAESSTTFGLIVDNVAPTITVENAGVTVDESNTATNSGTFADAGVDSVSLVASVGTVVDAGEGIWSWSLNSSDGPDDSQEVTITATDSDGAESTVTFDLVVNNVAPTITAANDSITVTEGARAQNSGTFADVGQDTLTLAASIGDVVDSGDGVWSWSFDTADGPDQTQFVTITATDSDGLATTVTFDLQVTNAIPTLSVDNPEVIVTEGGTAGNSGSVGDAGDDVLNITVSIGEVVDNENGSWTWSFDSTDGPDDTQLVTVTVTDSDGNASATTFSLTVNNVVPTLSIDESTVTVGEGETATNSGLLADVGDDELTIAASVGTTTDNGDGTWSWSFETSDGPDQSQEVEVTVTDSDGAAVTNSFVLNVLNVAPEIAVDNLAVTVQEGSIATNSGTVGDVGDDVVEVTASVGEITMTEEGWSWSYDSTDGPDESQVVTVTATDSDGAFVEVTFDLNVENVAPAISVDNAEVSVDEGSTATNTGSFVDVGNDSVMLSASIGSVSENEGGGWIWDFDTSDGPVESQTVTITATDSDGASVEATFDVTVANVAAVVSADNEVVNVSEGAPAANTGTVSDVGDDEVTLNASVGEVTQSEGGLWSWSYTPRMARMHRRR